MRKNNCNFEYISESFAEAMKLTTIGLQLQLIYGCGDDFLQLSAIIYIFFASQKTTCFQIKLHRRDFAITLAENDITLEELDSPTLYALTKQTANLSVMFISPQGSTVNVIGDVCQPTSLLFLHTQIIQHSRT